MGGSGVARGSPSGPVPIEILTYESTTQITEPELPGPRRGVNRADPLHGLRAPCGTSYNDAPAQNFPRYRIAPPKKKLRCIEGSQKVSLS